MKKATVKRKRDKCGTAYGETFANSSCGIACSVEPISDFSYLFSHLSHLGDPASIVTDWTIPVNSKAQRKVGEHA